MSPLGIIDRLLEEIAFAALRSLDCHRHLVHCRVEEADEQQSLSIGRTGIPVDGHNRHGVTDEDETKDEAVERCGDNFPYRSSLLLLFFLILWLVIQLLSASRWHGHRERERAQERGGMKKGGE